jgi:DedD protein
VERHVKERLVGAAVLMAAAIILIPEMLSGPDRAEPVMQERAAAPAPIKTYTIDLNPSRSGVANGQIDDRAPPPETLPAATAMEDERRSDVQAPPESAARVSPASEPAPRPSGPAKPPETRAADPAPPPAKRVDPAPLASSQPPPTSGAWAVQIGSFSRQDTAENLAAQLRSAGHPAFVMPIRSGSGALYRVRVGPMKDRAGAETALRELQSRSPGAAVVAHP